MIRDETKTETGNMIMLSPRRLSFFSETETGTLLNLTLGHWLTFFYNCPVDFSNASVSISVFVSSFEVAKLKKHKLCYCLSFSFHFGFCLRGPFFWCRTNLSKYLHRWIFKPKCRPVYVSPFISIRARLITQGQKMKKYKARELFFLSYHFCVFCLW